jgi:hypothetical protein
MSVYRVKSFCPPTNSRNVTSSGLLEESSVTARG